MGDDYITAYQAAFYTQHGLEHLIPDHWVVQAAEQVNNKTLFIDEAPTLAANTFMEVMSSEIYQDEITGVNPTLERMIYDSTPASATVTLPQFGPVDPPPSLAPSTPTIISVPLAVPTPIIKPDPSQIIPMELTPPIPAPAPVEVIGDLAASIADPFGIFTSRPSDTSINFTQSGLGESSMVMTGGIQGVSKLAVMFSGIGNVISKTNGRIPLGRGFMSRVGQVFAGLGIADIIGLGNPFNNQSDTDQVQDMIYDALESGAITDNRGFNYATNEAKPLQAVIILYDRMGRDVERMYAVSFRPANPQSVRRRSIRNNNIIRRRRTPARRSR